MVTAFCALGLCAFVQAAEFDVPALAAKALVDAGNPARLQRVIARSRRGEPVTIAVIGGSITQGAKATKPEFRYGNRLADWWQEQFPGSKVSFHNAGIGATGSNYGALRCRRDLLSHSPDLVVVEYAVNDGPGQDTRESIEGLVRQILAEPQQPAALMLFTFGRGGNNRQADHETVGRHYGLPMISFRDAVWPEIEAGRCAWEDVIADEVHPNDLGHELCARFLTCLLYTSRCVMLFTFGRGGNNRQADHETVGRHYGLPMISFRDAVWPEIEAGRCAWEDVIADEVHPNDLGHELCARFLTAYLAQQMATAPTTPPAITALPAPVHSDVFCRCELQEAAELKPVRADGFTLQNGRWRASQPGSVFEAEIAGERIYLMFWRSKGPMGRATVSIDGGPPTTLEAWFDQTWGGYRVLQLVGRDLSPGAHKVKVTVLDEKHDESDGHEFEVMGLGGVGVAR